MNDEGQSGRGEFDELLLESGLIGTALYFAFLIGAALRYRAATRWGRYEYAGQVGAVGLAGLIAYQVQGMFVLSPTSPGHGIYFMLFIGATLRACTAAPTTWRAASPQID
jgi:O-antigen ligase